MRARFGSFVLLAACVVVLGATLRSIDLGRSLWLDEAWVANSVLEPRLVDCLYYPAWLQTTPPLLLVGMRGAVSLLGPSNLAFRLVPWMLGVAALVPFAWLARRLLPPAAALLALFVFAASPPLAWFGASAKQFSADVFAAVAMLALVHRALVRRTPRALALATACWTGLAFLSYPAQLFLPVLAWAAWRTGREPTGGPAGAAPGVATGRGRGLWAVAIVCVLGAAVAAVTHFAFVVPNRDPGLVGYWSDAFPATWAPSSLLLYLRERVTAFMAGFFFVPGRPLLRRASVLAITLGAAGLLARAGRSEALDRAVLLLGAPAALLGANVLGLYPVPADLYGGRLLLVAFPGLVLLFAAGIASADAGLRRLASAAGAPAVPPAGSATAVVLALAAAAFGLQLVREGPAATVRVGFPEDGEAAVAALAATTTPRDVVYVHASMAEQFRLYARRTPVDAARIVMGRIGGPCCPRATPSDWGEPAARRVPPEVERLELDALRGRLHLFFADRGGYWALVGRDDPLAFREALEARGCEQVSSHRFPGTRFDTYACRTAASR